MPLTQENSRGSVYDEGIEIEVADKQNHDEKIITMGFLYCRIGKHSLKKRRIDKRNNAVSITSAN